MRKFYMAALVFMFMGAVPALCQQPVSFKADKIGISRYARVNLKEISKDYYPKLQHIAYPAPGTAGASEEAGSLHGRSLKKNEPARKMAGDADLPILRRNFMGNLWQGGTPNDNDLAISNDGKVVSVINSTMNIYSANGDSLSFVSLAAFSEELGFTHTKYDPKVVYDPVEDRFILVFLNGNLDSTSQIIIAFTATNDPAGDWNIYSLSGNPINNSTWTDYPSIGISTKEIFIGVNTFRNGSQNNSGFQESCLWQIDKFDGYNGSDLDTRYYHDIANGDKVIFNLMPVTGARELYGPHMYCISNRNRDYQNDTILLYKVTGTLDDVNTRLELTKLKADGVYGLPPRGKQLQTNNNLITNDARVLDALYVDNTIHFVGNTRHTGSQLCGIYHGIISNTDTQPELKINEIGGEPADVAFPAIAWAGRTAGDDAVIIAVNFTSSEDFAGMGAFYYADGAYSDLVKIREGEAAINLMIGDDRWGDYSGAQQKYNEPGKVWISAGFGRRVGSGINTSYVNGTWIAEVENPAGASVSVEEKEETANAMNMYPVPAQRSQLLHMNFTLEKETYLSIDIYDMSGRKVTTLLTDKAKPGENMFSFSAAPLQAGVYFVRISGAEGELFSRKFVVQ